MLRVASFKVVPCAFRAVASPRNLSPRLTNAFVSVANPAPLSRRFYCKAYASEKVVKALDSEIQLKQFIKQRPVPPPDFAFKVEQSGYFRASHVFLSRELDGEEIDIRVLDPIDDGNSTADNQTDDGTTTTDSDSDSCSDSDTSDSDSDSYSDSTEEEEEEEKIPVESVPLKIEITKRNGQSLKFGAIVSADKVLVERLTTKEGDKVICSQLYIKPDSELQKALRKFLEVRGIEKSMAGFLYNHMIWKSKIPNEMHSRSIEEMSLPTDEAYVDKLSKLKEVIQGW